MRLAFYPPGTNTCEVQWMWLPTFIGQNVALMKELELELNKTFQKRLATEATLNAVHVQIISWLDKKLHIPGLVEYLEGIKYVQEQ